MKLIYAISILLMSQVKSFGQTSNIESKLSNLQNQFVGYISEGNCNAYLNKIEYLIDEVDELYRKNSGNQELKSLKKKLEAYKNYSSTLTGCGGSGDQVSLKYFYEFQNATNLSPRLLTRNNCGELYVLEVGDFSTYYVINNGPGKTYSIIIETDTRRISITLGARCKVARGFNQGEKIGKMLKIGCTCNSISEECWEF
ncbi:MAG: hypothetical protein M9900_12615 [Flavobacteriales bacterium]|nr:hypothetical protein [Flavobacteriales bacterium]